MCSLNITIVIVMILLKKLKGLLWETEKQFRLEDVPIQISQHGVKTKNDKITYGVPCVALVQRAKEITNLSNN